MIDKPLVSPDPLQPVIRVLKTLPRSQCVITSLLPKFRDQLISSDIPLLDFRSLQHWLERELLPRSSPWLIQLLADLRRIKLCTILRQTIESLEGIFPLCQD